jgi:hypothetical protein
MSWALSKHSVSSASMMRLWRASRSSSGILSIGECSGIPMWDWRAGRVVPCQETTTRPSSAAPTAAGAASNTSLPYIPAIHGKSGPHQRAGVRAGGGDQHQRGHRHGSSLFSHAPFALSPLGWRHVHMWTCPRTRIACHTRGQKTIPPFLPLVDACCRTTIIDISRGLYNHYNVHPEKWMYGKRTNPTAVAITRQLFLSARSHV